MILTGGGTRGIYQIGALQALSEQGIFDDFVSISGCSIGALNAVLLCQYNIDECKEIWHDIANREVFKGINQYSRTYFFKLAKESIFNDGVNINPFIDIFNEYIDEDIVRKTDREVIVTTFNVSKKRQEYYALTDIPHGQLCNYIIASSRLPFFQPVIINGDKYVDGGAGDNIPYYSQLEDSHFDLLLMIKIMSIPYYIPGHRIVNITYDEEVVIKPSKRIGTPISFRYPSFDKKYDMGFRDAMEVINKKL